MQQPSRNKITTRLQKEWSRILCRATSSLYGKHVGSTDRAASPQQHTAACSRPREVQNLVVAIANQSVTSSSRKAGGSTEIVSYPSVMLDSEGRGVSQHVAAAAYPDRMTSSCCIGAFGSGLYLPRHEVLQGPGHQVHCHLSLR